MAANSKFAIALHTLGILAYAGDRPVSSDMIAKSVDTNPVVIRRIISNFVKKGLVSVQMGSGGGSRLTRPAAEISLADVYESLGEDGLFDVPALTKDHCCPLGIIVRPVLVGIFGDVEQKMVENLRCTSLKDVIEEVGEKMRCETDGSI